MLPLKYNVRNLRARYTSTLLTILSTALVVFSSCWLFGLVAGLEHSLSVSGDPLDLVVLRKGSTGEIDGGFDSTKADELLTLPGIARDQQGRPIASRELLHIPLMLRRDGSRANLTFRGVEWPASSELRSGFQIASGRAPVPGRGECIVAVPISKRFQGARIGETLQTSEREAYRVVGTFTAGGSSAESEVWLDRKDLERNIAREGAVSSVQIRAASPSAFNALRDRIDNDTQFRLKAKPERELFQQQNSATIILKVAGYLIAVLLAFGAMFAAANTMFAAVSSRTREIGTMRALGFSRRSILVSFLLESVLLCTLGGVIGMLATVPLRAFSFTTMNNFTEAAFHFRFNWQVLTVAFLMTLAMGVFGGLFPAMRAVRLDVVKSLREL